MKPSRRESFSETGNSGTRIVLFCTSWSSPCRQQWKILDILRSHFGNDTEIARIDLDHSPESADKWAIQSIPTTLLLSGNKEIDRFIGVLSSEMLETILDDRVHPAHQVFTTAINKRR